MADRHLAAVPAPRLGQLAREVRDEIAAAESAWESAVEHAYRAGVLLNEARALCRHGHWLPWLKEVGIPVRTATSYRQFAKLADPANLPATIAALLPAPRRSQPERSAADELRVAVRIAASFTSTRSAIDALHGVRVRVDEGGGVELAATDQDVTVTIPLGVQAGGAVDAAEPFEALLPARLLLYALDAVPGVVSLKCLAASGELALSGGDATIGLRTLRLEDFPPVPPAPPAVATLPAAAFVAAIGRVSRAASRDETRPVLTAIRITAAAGVLELVATDRGRMAIERQEVDAADFGPLLVYRQALDKLALIVGDDDEPVSIGAADDWTAFAAGGARMFARRAEAAYTAVPGRFPEPAALIPSEFERELTVDRSQLLAIVRRLIPFALPSHQLRLTVEAGVLRASVHAPNVAHVRTAMPVGYAGAPVTVALNPIFLSDGLAGITEDEVTIRMSGPLEPLLIQSPDDGFRFRYVLMPLRADESAA